MMYGSRVSDYLARPTRDRAPGMADVPDSGFGVASQLPYDMIVDAMRQGAMNFGGLEPRPLTKDEKLQATLGSLQTFFGRLSKIGQPPGWQGPGDDLIASGQQAYEQAKSGPQREMIGQAMTEAARRRAVMEQAAQQRALEGQALERNALVANTFAKMAPDIGPRVQQMPEGVAGPPQTEDVPPGLYEQVMRTGDFSPLAPYLQPGMGEKRKEQRQLDLEARREERQLATERENRASIEREGAANRAADAPLKASQTKRNLKAAEGAEGNKISYKEAKAAIDDRVARFRDRPPMQYKAIMDWVAQNAADGIDMDDKTAAYVKGEIATMKRSALAQTAHGFTPMKSP